MEILYIMLGFALGGILKGATGAGAPVIGVPVVALFYDVPTAVVVFVIPSLLTNVWQCWTFRKDQLPAPFSMRFAITGLIGAVLGTVMLKYLPTQFLTLLVGVSVLLYIAFRLAKPDWKLLYEQALRIVVPVGFIAGILQGASGISAPVSVTYLNAMRLERAQFIGTIALFFVSMSTVQLPMMVSLGLMTERLFWIGCAALVPLVVFMPVGSFLARHISQKVFDRCILALLAIIAVKLVADVFLKG